MLFYIENFLILQTDLNFLNKLTYDLLKFLIIKQTYLTNCLLFSYTFILIFNLTTNRF